jgi:ABC-type dipeptide/oligopeptide/nickel transport system permease component
MLRFALTRLARTLGVLLGVSLLTFLVGHASGDPVLLIVRGDATAEQKAQLRHSLGLDRPVLAQYTSYVAHAVEGDLGISYRQRVSVASLIKLRLPNSLELAGTAFVAAVTVGFLLGALAALKRGGLVDHAVAALAVLGQVVPGFWLGLLLVIVFAVHWPLFPVSGYGDLRHLILPAVTLALPTLGRMARLVRSAMLEVLGSDFIRTARAKGLREWQVLLRHAARNALLPVITQAGLELGDMVGSAFIVESVFAWPGIGRMTVNAVQQRDFLVVQGCVLVTATAFVLINLLVDLLYAAIDPRVRIRA